MKVEVLCLTGIYPLLVRFLLFGFAESIVLMLEVYFVAHASPKTAHRRGLFTTVYRVVLLLAVVTVPINLMEKDPRALATTTIKLASQSYLG